MTRKTRNRRTKDKKRNSVAALLDGLLTLMFAKPKNIQLISAAKNYQDFLKILPTLNLE